MRFDVVIIGAGAVGLATAYRLVCAYPALRVGIVEQAAQVAAHQTGHNSGVIHSGIYYKPGSLKAQNCITGRAALIAFATQHKVAFDLCGKIIVATQAHELVTLEKIYQTGLANGLDQIRLIEPDEITQIEPHCRGLRAIFVPYAGIIDYIQLCQKLSAFVTQFPHNQLLFNHRLTNLTYKQNTYELQTNQGKIETALLICCAGLQSDRMALLEGIALDTRIVPFRGDYYELKASHKVRGLIYPVPDLNFPFLGVHFTRMIRGGVECGPNAVFSFAREGYGRFDFNLKDTLDALGFVGTRNFFKRHWRTGLAELKRAHSKQLFLAALQKMIPDLQANELQYHGAGIRAAALEASGNLTDDFKFALGSRSIHVLNAPSPAATACLAIADTILNQMKAQNWI